MAATAYRRLLLALDASAARNELVSATLALAQPDQTEVLVLHAHPPGEPTPEAVAETACSQLAFAGITASAETVEAGPRRVAGLIADRAETFGAELVVMGSRGLPELRAVLAGSVSHEVIIRTARPVLLIKTGLAAGELDWRRVLTAVELEADLDPLVEAVAGLGRVASVLVLHVREMAFTEAAAYIEPEEEARVVGEKAVAALGERGLAAELRIVHGPAGDVGHAIAREAAAAGADVIVVGSRRPGTAEGVIAGSTARSVLHHSDRPVLIARRAEAPATVRPRAGEH